MSVPPSVRSARILLTALADLGVRDVVLAPGSRSAPLAYAAAELADEGAVRLHVRIDERSAGFLGLGLGRGRMLDGEPAPAVVLTTSGTAAANLHPAVLEAHHSGVPLLLLTADRPHELRGVGANQTTRQADLFGTAVRLSVDLPAPTGLPSEPRDLRTLAARAVAAALGSRSLDPGPVHLNLAFREPLSPLPEESAEERAVPQGLPPAVLVGPGRDGTETESVEHGLRPGVPTVVVAGDDAGPLATRLAQAQGWPLLAEVSSGAAGGGAIRAHRLVLAAAPIAREVRRAVVLGRPTLSRPVLELLERPEVEVVVVAPGTRPWSDAARNAAVVLPGVPAAWMRGAEVPDVDWLHRWQHAGMVAQKIVAEALDRPAGQVPPGVEPAGLSGLQVAACVAAASGSQDVIVVGSSNPVRDLDLVAGWEDPPRVIANRGLSGIDGVVSTALGVALGASPRFAGDTEPEEGRRVRALLGDLTFLHDAGGLLRGPGEPEADLQIVVANDDGGSIFATLEHGALAVHDAARRDQVERVFATPHGARLGALCAGYGVPHRRVDTVATLAAALAVPPPGVSVVEVVVDRGGRRADEDALTARVAEALAH